MELKKQGYKTYRHLLRGFTYERKYVRGWSQSKLVAEVLARNNGLKVSVATVSNFERHKLIPRLRIFKALLNCLGFDVNSAHVLYLKAQHNKERIADARR